MPRGTRAAEPNRGDEDRPFPKRPLNPMQLMHYNSGARCTIILHMTVLPVAEARVQFSKLVDSAIKTHDRITVTRNGIPAVVILSEDDYEGMRATIETLADSEEMAAIAEGLADLRAGRIIGQDEMAETMRRAGRA